MQRRVLHADKMVAVKELIEFFHETSNILMQYGWTWHLENGRKITESFDAIKKHTLKNG